MELKVLEKADAGESRERFKAPTLLRSKDGVLEKGIRGNLIPEELLPVLN